MSALARCLLIVAVVAALSPSAPPAGTIPADWLTMAPREEIRPTFSADAAGALVIATDGTVGQHGWFQKTFAIHDTFDGYKVVDITVEGQGDTREAVVTVESRSGTRDTIRLRRSGPP